MNMVLKDSESEAIVKALPVDGSGFEWLNNVFFTRYGDVSNKNFKFDDVQGNLNIIRVINKLGRDYYEDLQHFRWVLSNEYIATIKGEPTSIAAAGITKKEKDDMYFGGAEKCRYYEDQIASLEDDIKHIGQFVLAFYQNDGDYVCTDTLIKNPSIIEKLIFKQEFYPLLERYKDRYSKEIQSAYNRLAEKTGKPLRIDAPIEDDTNALSIDD